MSARVIRWPSSHDAQRRPLVSKHLYDKLPPEQKEKYRAPGLQHLRRSGMDLPLCGTDNWDLLGELDNTACLKCLTAHDLLQEKARKDYKADRFRRNLAQWANFGESEWGALDWISLAATTVGLGVVPMLLAKPLLKGLYHLLYRNKEDKK